MGCAFLCYSAWNFYFLPLHDQETINACHNYLRPSDPVNGLFWNELYAILERPAELGCFVSPSPPVF